MSTTPEARRDPGVKVLRKAIQVLETFTPDRPSLPLGFIAKAVGLNPATAWRILGTLEEKGLITHDPDTREYSLGLKVLELGSRVAHSHLLRRVARPVMTELRDECGESVYLGVYDAGDVVYLDIVESPHPLRIVVRVGDRLPSHCTGTGKVLLAYLPQEELRTFLRRPLQRYLPTSPGTAAELLPHLATTLQAGYGVSSEEHFQGISSVGAPIWDRLGHVIAALSLCGPSQRLPETELHRLAPRVLAAARQISQALGSWSEGPQA